MQDSASRLQALALLALSSLLWAGNWVTGRALRDAFDPVTLNFWRWLLATAVLAPLALPGLRGRWPLVRRHARILLLLSLTGVAAFHGLVYLGLRTTTTVNAVLLNSSIPLFILLCSWILERERASARQVAGMLVSLAGILAILTRGEPANLVRLELHAGDAWILLAMPIWGVYSVLLKRRPAALGGLEFLFVISAAGVLMLAPAAAAMHLLAPRPAPGAAAILGVVYVALGASVLAYICWNRGVAVVGANAAGFTVHLLPAFGTLLAILFLGESFAAFHAVGIAIILAGVVLATRTPART
ncbi:MAG TPA: DMT family transporter [Burkholderiales bacterium]|jgi:drug/metabolite transporter (DMT)-like permease|nr:DMT family transporter [Burkholderiales bacterium]